MGTAVPDRKSDKKGGSRNFWRAEVAVTRNSGSTVGLGASVVKHHAFLLRLVCRQLAALFISSCGRNDPAEEGGIPVDSDSTLYRVTGLTGLVETGDELIALDYPVESREARIRKRNIDAARLSWMDTRANSELEQSSRAI